MLPHSSWAALFIFFRGTVIKSRDKARTVLCRSRYLRYLSPFFTLRAALLFFALISLHQNAKNRKKKIRKKKEREAAQARLHRENSVSTEPGRRRAWSWRKRRVGVLGRILGAALSQGSPCARFGASCSQLGHPTWLCPLRVLPCPWSPHGSCWLPWSAPGWL